jgi:glucosylceramidase
MSRIRISTISACLVLFVGACGSGNGEPSQPGTCVTSGTTDVDGGAVSGSGVLVTSAQNVYWQPATWTEVAGGNADVTVNDCAEQQTWDGFGGTFNEMGWNYLSTQALQDEAMQLLFGADGCRFAWGRIPIGASDYAMDRYTLDDTGADVIPDGAESNRPPADTSLSQFSIERDKQKLIPYIKAAQAVKPDLRFWGSPWTPPVWMKTGYRTTEATGAIASKPSYFDGGGIKTDDATLRAHAKYFVKFVQAYQEQGINIEVVAPQNEPNYDPNYPSCLWDKAAYVAFLKLLGPGLMSAGLATKVMLGTMSNADSGKDPDIASAVLSDIYATGNIGLIGVQWGMLDKVASVSSSGLPVWVTEHRCGNYPWQSNYQAIAPNDHAYAKESWEEIRKAIIGKVTAYNAWNMVLDKVGKGIDTGRDWAQNSLLVVDGGVIIKTPAYYVFRHFSQFVDPGAKVLATSGGDAFGFKNPDGSLVAVLHASSAKSNYTVRIAGKNLQFSMPGDGWATIKY